jgi:hypothetical protein
MLEAEIKYARYGTGAQIEKSAGKQQPDERAWGVKATDATPQPMEFAS